MGDQEFVVTQKVTFKEVVLTTPAGPLMLRNLEFYIEEANLARDLTLGHPTDELLVRARV